ncbi:MAG: inositol monophosphatase family protein [Opitutales bacterium]
MARSRKKSVRPGKETQFRHRINAGRVAVLNQTPFFRRQFGQVTSEWKPDDTRVTFADFAISEKVFAELRRDFPEDNYCSEEASPRDEVLALDGPFAWVIDPIDGTNNYALGFPVCAISLALLREGRPVYGFVYDHSTDMLIEGGPEHGLFRNRKKFNRARVAAEAQAMLGLHFPMEAAIVERIAPLLARYRIRCLGSAALIATYVATGYLNGAIDLRVKVWDIAAAYALCQAAGIRFEFTGKNPFPLTSFHAEAARCPYFAGPDPFFGEIAHALNQSRPAK